MLTSIQCANMIATIPNDVVKKELFAVLNQYSTVETPGAEIWKIIKAHVSTDEKAGSSSKKRKFIDGNALEVWKVCGCVVVMLLLCVLMPCTYVRSYHVLRSRTL